MAPCGRLMCGAHRRPRAGLLAVGGTRAPEPSVPKGLCPPGCLISSQAPCSQHVGGTGMAHVHLQTWLWPCGSPTPGPTECPPPAQAALSRLPPGAAPESDAHQWKPQRPHRDISSPGFGTAGATVLSPRATFLDGEERSLCWQGPRPSKTGSVCSDPPASAFAPQSRGGRAVTSVSGNRAGLRMPWKQLF